MAYASRIIKTLLLRAAAAVNSRRLEDNTVRTLEDGTPRILE